MTVKDIDKGWKAYKNNMGLFDRSYTSVGVQQGSQEVLNEPEPLSDLITKAVVNEFGAPRRNIPSRPFFRSAFDMNLKKIEVFQVSTYKAITDGRMSVRKGLQIIGQFMESRIKKRILFLTSPPNAQSTIDKKGSSNPLIDTGNLRQSIIHTETIR